MVTTSGIYVSLLLMLIPPPITHPVYWYNTIPCCLCVSLCL